ncbi:hypothetical protein [Breznakiella homolactica]|uniref:Uncharacterized protein n=1 Tax=Breznakiella homolactica TaxID=2798577 RepID=A0A7T8BB38_9SPIR|nr:hypothetical protein [Breznakiella homolactica]QQO09635.1 hypothetical protein JFL75_01575 [Breznakiella homolactica]
MANSKKKNFWIPKKKKEIIYRSLPYRAMLPDKVNMDWLDNYRVSHFPNLEIEESREYYSFFQTESKPECKSTFDMDPFYLEFNHKSQKGTLRIRDAGGHADSCPRSYEQLAWIEERIKPLAFKDTWTTNWDIGDAASYAKFNDMLIDDRSYLIRLRYKIKKDDFCDFLLQSYIYDNPLPRLAKIYGEVESFILDLSNFVYERTAVELQEKENLSPEEKFNIFEKHLKIGTAKVIIDTLKNTNEIYVKMVDKEFY